jgi:hypothetical protein
MYGARFISVHFLYLQQVTFFSSVRTSIIGDWASGANFLGLIVLRVNFSNALCPKLNIESRRAKLQAPWDRWVQSPWPCDEISHLSGIRRLFWQQCSIQGFQKRCFSRHFRPLWFRDCGCLRGRGADEKRGIF